MSNSQNVPSYEALRAQNQAPRFSPEFLRLRWKPFGPLATSIHVANNARDPPSAEDQTYSQGPSMFHPISASSLTEPRISLITVTQGDLDEWEHEWVDEHLPHADYDGAVWSGGGEAVLEIDENATVYEHQVDDETGHKLMRCCDEDRPPAQAPRLVVRPSTKPYVTIHDYVTAVHAWLQTHRDDILRAKGVHESGPVPTDTVFYVNLLEIDTVRLDDGNTHSDFGGLWSQVASVADRLGGAGGGFPTAAFLAASRQPLSPQNLSQQPPPGYFTMPQRPLQWRSPGTGPAPAVPGQLHRVEED